ncbi:MAG: hypothetical protein NTY48_04370 [Candidatus Diapherotrites archaeon]|nr:hypothetical protein [Candidatus Diapherotrites archaeon]
MSKKKNFEITYQGKTAVKLFTDTKEGKQGETDTRVLWSEKGSGKHITTIITKDSKISSHLTNEFLPIDETDAKEVFEKMGTELQKQFFGKVYLGDDLILLKKDKLQDFVNLIKGDENKDNHKLELSPLIEEEGKKQLAEYFAGPIKRQELEKYKEPQILTNKEKKILLYYEGKVYDLTETVNNFFGNILGALMGVSEQGISLGQMSEKIVKDLFKEQKKED